MLQPQLTITDRLEVYRRIRKDIEEMDDTFVKVGFPQEARPGHPEKEGTHPIAKEMSEVAEIAAFQEFGTQHIPARPFFRQAIDNNKDALGVFIKREYDEVLLGVRSVYDGISRIGEWMSAKVKRTITTGDFKPLSPITIARKKSSRPLIDSGQMRQSVTYVVGHGQSTQAGQVASKGL